MSVEHATARPAFFPIHAREDVAQENRFPLTSGSLVDERQKHFGANALKSLAHQRSLPSLVRHEVINAVHVLRWTCSVGAQLEGSIVSQLHGPSGSTDFQLFGPKKQEPEFTRSILIRFVSVLVGA